MKHVLAIIGLCVLAGCSGGGGNATPQTVAPSVVPESGTQKVSGTATIFIPASRKETTGNSRRREWVSPSTMGLNIATTLADGYGYAVTTAVTPTSPNCVTQTGGRNCTVQFAAAPGINTIQLYAYDNANEYHAGLLATATSIGVDITAGAANSETFVLGGVVGLPPTLSPTSFSVKKGTAQTLTLTITGDDIDGNPIGLYDSPLMITQTDTSGTYTLSTASIADSSVTPSITIAYNGGAASTTITVASSSANTMLYYGPQSTTITITPQ